MPWHLEPMKDVVCCDKPRGAASRRYYSRISEWGNPTLRKQGKPALRREIPSTKYQIANKFQVSNSKHQTGNCFGFGILSPLRSSTLRDESSGSDSNERPAEEVWNLFGTWDFGFGISARSAGGEPGEVKHPSSQRKRKRM